MDEAIRQKLSEFYHGTIPEHVADASKDYITLRFRHELFGMREYLIPVCDVYEYFSSKEEPLDEEKLGTLRGDHEFIYRTALECLRWFKFINPDETSARKKGTA